VDQIKNKSPVTHHYCHQFCQEENSICVYSGKFSPVQQKQFLVMEQNFHRKFAFQAQNNNIYLLEKLHTIIRNTTC